VAAHRRKSRWPLFAGPRLAGQDRPARITRPVVACVIAGGVLGGSVLLDATIPHGKPIAAPESGPLPVVVIAPASQAGPGNRDAAPRHRERTTTHRTRTTTTARHTQRRSATVSVSASASATAGHPSASPASTTPAVLVRYVVSGMSGTTFEGEVEVVNNGRQPLAGWQISVGLAGDEVTAIQNASGYFINGILLMQPATSTEVVPPDGGTLRVFFAGEGFRTMPLACTFNGISCQ
jgi:hypothetical protein